MRTNQGPTYAVTYMVQMWPEEYMLSFLGKIS